MELQAIIGKVHGYIGTNDLCRIMAHLYTNERAKSLENNGRGANNINIDKLDLFVPFQFEVCKNIYIHSGLTDPQSFFRYLAKEGYVVRDSILTQEAHKKDSHKLSNISGCSPYVSPRGITEENPNKSEQIRGE